jgi:hypothetical protein
MRTPPAIRLFLSRPRLLSRSIVIRLRPQRSIRSAIVSKDLVGAADRLLVDFLEGGR